MQLYNKASEQKWDICVSRSQKNSAKNNGKLSNKGIQCRKETSAKGCSGNKPATVMNIHSKEFFFLTSYHSVETWSKEMGTVKIILVVS